MGTEDMVVLLIPFIRIERHKGSTRCPPARTASVCPALHESNFKLQRLSHKCPISSIQFVSSDLIIYFVHPTECRPEATLLRKY